MSLCQYSCFEFQYQILYVTVPGGFSPTFSYSFLGNPFHSSSVLVNSSRSSLKCCYLLGVSPPTLRGILNCGFFNDTSGRCKTYVRRREGAPLRPCPVLSGSSMAVTKHKQFSRKLENQRPDSVLRQRRKETSGQSNSQLQVSQEYRLPSQPNTYMKLMVWTLTASVGTMALYVLSSTKRWI